MTRREIVELQGQPDVERTVPYYMVSKDGAWKHLAFRPHSYNLPGHFRSWLWSRYPSVMTTMGEKYPVDGGLYLVEIYWDPLKNESACFGFTDADRTTKCSVHRGWRAPSWENSYWVTSPSDESTFPLTSPSTSKLDPRR